MVDAIHEACLKILHEEGHATLTTQRIADVAGINIASLYQYFPNKEAVLASIYEQEVSQSAEQTRRRFTELAQLSQDSLEKTLAAIIDIETTQLSKLYQMSPAFYLAYKESFDIHQRLDDLTQSLANPSWSEWFPQFLKSHSQRLRDGDLETISFIARASLAGNLQQAIKEQPERLNDETFKQELLTLLLSYLLKPAN